ncbi:MAG: ABC transporter permease [Bacteroidota bacterium]
MKKRYGQRWAMALSGFYLLLCLVFAWVGVDFLPDSTLYANQQNPDAAALPMFSQGVTNHWLGTDSMGRDLWSRLVWGIRVSMGTGLVAMALSIALGTIVGLAAGYYRSWVDRVLSWFMQVLWSLPSVMLVLAFSLALGKGWWQVMLAIGLTMWVDVARMVRGQVMALREREFMLAARMLGLSDWNQMFKQLLPNLYKPLMVMASSVFGSAILLESGLGFLGLGVQPPVPSLGMMLKEHVPYLLMGSPHLALAPGLLIFSLVFGFNILGAALSSYWDTPR